MFEKQSKNVLILNILQILQKHSGVKHPLTQNDIIKLLKEEYDMDVERKSITRNIDNLIEAGYDIGYEESKKGKGKNKTIVRTNFYYEHDFDDSELMFLIDGLIFSKLITRSQKKMLIKKLECLSNKYFKTSLNKVDYSQSDKTKNEDLFLNIEIIAEAIKKSKKIKFNYLTYDLSKKLVYRKDDKGNIKEYVMSPYQMVAANGRYYLLCAYDKYDDISNIRIDRIKNAQILNEPIEKNSILRDYNVPRHMIEHIYMMSGESEVVTFEFNRKILKDVIDWFGDEITFKDNSSKGTVFATVKVNENAMRFWAMQYGENVTIKSPKKLVEKMKKQLRDMIDRYK